MGIRVLVNGSKGRMGQEVVRAVRGESDLELVGETDLGDDLAATIRSSGARVVVDFTRPDVAFLNTRTILESGASPVVGTTGFSPDDISRLQRQAAELRIGGLIAPNFAIGAILLMKFAAEAVKYFPDVEVIEFHHEKKLDAPSGTALKTIDVLDAAKRESAGQFARPATRPVEHESVPGSRGGLERGIRVHSVRLPGFVAHQEVIFGGSGEILTLRHDAPARTAFMPGVILATRRVVTLDRLYHGLETIL
jgi:4-hydroxy-tetrahydrodipicolinate reductase